MGGRRPSRRGRCGGGERGRQGLALGGCGIRFYGEYRLVLMLDQIDPDPQMFDRDSYDILLAPRPAGESRNGAARRNIWASSRPPWKAASSASARAAGSAAGTRITR